MNMHIPTPTEAAAIKRCLAFRADIAAKAKRLEEAKRAPQRPNLPPLIFGLPSFYLSKYRRDRSTHQQINDIIDATAARFKITRGDLLSERRTKKVVLPRHIAVYLCRLLTQKSYPFIASRFGYFDHSVIVFAISKIERLMKTDPAIALHVEALSLEVGALS
jgi:hypothetical protein